jgi:hypothetical protein
MRHCADAGCGVALPSGSTDTFCFTCRLKVSLGTDPVSLGDSPVPRPPGQTLPVGPGAKIGDYEILDVVSSGGMGVIFRARQLSLGRTVALKMILGGQFASTEDVRRFRIEAEAVAAMDHPNIVPIYEVGQERGCDFFSMKLVEGGTLTQRIPGCVGETRWAARQMATVARAVHYAHQRGILHRDLKPGNVLLGPDDHPYLTDFGIARRIEGAKTFTQDGIIVGTPEYMAPEQATGEKKALTTAVDVYALGAILYEMLTGRPPFQGVTPLETLRFATEREPARPSSLARGVDKDLETICLRCLEKDPRRRYGSAELLALELESWLAGEPIRARRITTIERSIKWAKRRPILAALVGVCVVSALALLGGGLVFARRLNRELDRTEQARRELQVALTRQVAERIDGDLRRLAAIPQTMAVLLGQRADWSEEKLRASLGGLLRADERLFGVCAAFEPSRFEPGRDEYALYYYKTSSGTASKLLDSKSYTPLYRDWAWYREPKVKGRPVWIQPFLDTGGGDVWMTTYSVPFEREGRFAGVVTADVSIKDYVRDLRRWLDELRLGDDAYGFVLDQTGTIVSHPGPEFFRKKLSDLCGLRALGDGTETAADAWLGRRATYSSARVAASGWRFVAVVPEEPAERPRTGPLKGSEAGK